MDWRGSVLAWNGTSVLDVLTRVGEREIGRFSCSAAAARGADVGNKHGREGGALVDREAGGLRRGVDAESGDGFGVALLGAASDGDGGAVHVHLTVADLVEPGPGEGVLAWGDTFGDGELEFAGAGTVGVATNVAGCGGGTATDDRVDDLPLGAGGWGLVGGEGDLAGSTAMSGTADEGEGLIHSDGHGVARAFSFVDSGPLLAGEVGAVGCERAVVEGGLAVGNGRAHHHVSVGAGEEDGSKGHEDVACGWHGVMILMGSFRTMCLRSSLLGKELSVLEIEKSREGSRRFELLGDLMLPEL